MEIKSIIIGMMAFVLFISLSFGIMMDMYSVDKLDIDLADDNATAPLENLQTEMEAQRIVMQSNNEYIEDRVVGGNATELGKDVTESNLMASSLTALTKTPAYIGSFFVLFNTGISSIGGTIGGVIFESLWFFVGALAIIIAFILLSSVLRGNV